MEQNPVTVLVGIYGSEADAQADYDDVKGLNSFTDFGIFDAAVITKDGDGRVHVDKDEKSTRQGASWVRSSAFSFLPSSSPTWRSERWRGISGEGCPGQT